MLFKQKIAISNRQKHTLISTFCFYYLKLTNLKMLWIFLERYGILLFYYYYSQMKIQTLYDHTWNSHCQIKAWACWDVFNNLKNCLAFYWNRFCTFFQLELHNPFSFFSRMIQLCNNVLQSYKLFDNNTFFKIQKIH